VRSLDVDWVVLDRGQVEGVGHMLRINLPSLDAPEFGDLAVKRCGAGEGSGAA
jgi:hypothetical protein